MTRATFQGLFKYPKGHANAQMQGAQKPEREVYILSVERCGLQRNAVDGFIVKPSAFSGKDGVHLFTIAPPYGNALPVNSPYFSSIQYLSIFSGGAMGYLPVKQARQKQSSGMPVALSIPSTDR